VKAFHDGWGFMGSVVFHRSDRERGAAENLSHCPGRFGPVDRDDQVLCGWILRVGSMTQQRRGNRVCLLVDEAVLVAWLAGDDESVAQKHVGCRIVFDAGRWLTRSW